MMEKTLSREPLPGLDRLALARLVDRFYARVRADELLGPVFAAVVTDWDEHLARLTDFWCSVALREGSFRGNPMARHMPLPIGNGHFDRWLELWRSTATDLLPPDAAAHMIALAERIGHGLKLGLGLHPRGRDLGIPLAGRPLRDPPT